MVVKLIVLQLFLLFICDFASSQTYDEMNQLLNKLTNNSGYNAHLRPLNDQRETLQVYVDVSIFSIEQFDLQTGDVDIVALFYISWKDEFLTWNPDHYGNVTMLHIPSEPIWKPRLIQRRGITKTNEASAIDGGDFSPVLVRSNGMVEMFPAGMYRSKCKVDTTYYPFDQHECAYTFILNNHGYPDVNFNVPNSDMIMDRFEENAEWLVDSTNCKVITVTEPTYTVSYTGITVTITLRRRPLFDLVTFNTPGFLLQVLLAVSCLIPPSSGERLTYVVTMNLAFVFLVLAVQSRIPANSLKIPMVCYTTMLLQMANFIAILYNIYILYLNVTPRKNIFAFGLLRKLALRHKLAKTKFDRSAKSNKHDVCTLNNDENVKNGVNAVVVEQTSTGHSQIEDMYELEGCDIIAVCDIYFFRTYFAFNVIIGSIYTIMFIVIELW